MFDSVQPHRQQPTRLPHPWDTLQQNKSAKRIHIYPILGGFPSHLSHHRTLSRVPRDNQRWYKQIEGYTWGYMFLDWKNQYCENNYTIQGNLQI